MKKFLFVLLVVIPFISYPQVDTKEESPQTSMFELRRNAVYTEDLLSYSYERVLPVSDNFGFLLKGGFMIWDPLLPIVEIGAIKGKGRNFIEAGIGALIADTSDDDEGSFDFITFRLGYRYQAPKGFLFKASAIYSPDNFILPLIAVGYSF